MKEQFDYLVFIGRFQPFHVGHQRVTQRALQLAKHVIILVGSVDQPRTIKNPFQYMERMGMIFDALQLPNEDKSRLTVAPLHDEMYNDQKWVANVQRIVDDITHRENRAKLTKDAVPKIGIIGHKKDESSYYLDMFPQWGFVPHDMDEVVNATDIRSLYFQKQSLGYLKGIVSEPVYKFLEEFSKTSTFEQLAGEHEFIRKYKKGWEAAPYAPTFMTADACVIQSGHILLVQRKASPGAGLFALPGGFVNQSELVVDAMLRELREETRLKVPAPVLKGSIKAEKLFDNPNRSLRGRTITMAYFIELPPGPLPTVKGGDDAAKAKWVPLSEVKEDQMFEDHYSIIQYFLGV